MVEIKRTRSGQSFLNKPVGVTKVTTGAEKVYAQQAEILSGVGEFAFDLAKEDQITRGKEYANTARVRDENGKLDYKALPFDLGRYGQAAANEILSNRYMIALQDDMVTAATKISETSDGDPTKFETAFSDWAKQRANLIEGTGGTDIIAPFIDSAYTFQKEFVNDLVIKRLEAEKKATNATYSLNIRRQSNDLKGALIAGEYEDASNIFNSAILQNNNLYKKGIINLDTRNKSETQILRAKFDGLVDSRFAEVDPKFKQALAIELRGGVTPFNILEKNSDIKEAYNSLGNSEQSKTVGFLTNTATQQKQFFEANKENVQSIRKVGMGIATGKDVSSYLQAATFENASGETEVIGNGFDILRSVESMEAASGFMRQAGHLEPEFSGIVKNMINGVNYGDSNQAILSTALNAIESDQMANGRSVLRDDMGLDTTDILKINYLREAQRDGPTAFENALNILSTSKVRYETVKENLGESFKAKTLLGLADEVADKMGISKELKPELRNTIVDSLVLHGSFSKASDAVNEVVEQLYSESDYVEGMTKFAPEKRIPELAVTKDHRYNFLTYALEAFKGDRNYGTEIFGRDEDGLRNPLDEVINKKLSLSLSRNLTRDDITLVANQNLSDEKRTVYFIKDKKTGLNVTDRRGHNVVIDTKELDNLIKAEKTRDEDYNNRYTAGSDEFEIFTQGMFGPFTRLSGSFLKETAIRLHTQGRDFELPATGLTQTYSPVIEKMISSD